MRSGAQWYPPSTIGDNSMATNLVGGPANPVYLVDANGNTISPSSGGASSITSPLGRQADAASVSAALSTEDIALLTALLTQSDFDTKIGSLTEAAPATDTASSGLNGRLQRIAQRLTTLLAVFPATIDTNSGNKSASTLRIVLATDQPSLTNAQPVNLQPTTSGGSTPYRNLDLGVTGQVVKASAGQLYNYFISNNAIAARFVKFYDKATAPDQNDTPVWTFQIPAGSAANVAFPNGIAFAIGISIRGTTGVADNNTGAPSANDIVVNLGYK